MKLQLNQNDIMSMVSETIKRLGNRRLLSEITAFDAYNRFYKDKLPEQMYKVAMCGATNMTPFHKILLDYLVIPEPDYKEKYHIYGLNKEKLAKMAGELWARAGQEGRQFLIKTCTEDRDFGKNLGMFYRLLEKVGRMKSFSEKQYRSRGFEVLYEDENIRVTCTKSYSSSCHFYGDSHWCTASDQFGQYDGLEMFIEYTIGCYNGRGILVQFIPKQKPKTYGYQINYSVTDEGDIEEGQCCDWNDQNATSADIKWMLSAFNLNYDEIFNKYIKPNAKRLSEETAEVVMDERVYYDRKKNARFKKIFGGFNNGITSKNADEFAKKSMVEVNNDPSKGPRFESEDGLYTAWTHRNKNGFTQVMVRYNGANESEKTVLEQYYEYSTDAFEERYGMLPRNFAVYAFEPNGNLHKKWRAEISSMLGRLLFLTECYDEELYGTKIVAVVDTETYDDIFVDVYSQISLEDTSYFINRNINNFMTALNADRSEELDTDDIDVSEWFICQPTSDCYRNGEYVAINSLSLEKVWFQI